MRPEQNESISDALVNLALALGGSGAVPVPELVRALERAAERLRTAAVPTELPHDLVSQAEASRAIGVSRQAVNQWVRNGLLRSYVRPGAGGRATPEVSLSEVAIAANRRSREVPFSGPRRRELLDFLGLLEQHATQPLASAIRRSIEEEASPRKTEEQSRILREFVIAAMGVGDKQQEFTAEGVELLAGLSPWVEVDRGTELGGLLDSLGLLVQSGDGRVGFDSPATALLGLVGVATVGGQYPEPDSRIGRYVALTAEDVWGEDWLERLYDAVYHVGELRPSPLTRYTASLTYLDNHRFLRRAQATGVSISYARGPGPILPQRFYGAHVLDDVLDGGRDMSAPWAWLAGKGSRTRPGDMPSTENPYRVLNYEYGLLDDSIHGIRRYCFSAADARAGLRGHLDRLPAGQRTAYVDCAIDTLARTLGRSFVELASVNRQVDFDWWKDHIIRSSEREIVIGLRDERARRTAHALLVQTSMLPEVVEAAESDAHLRDRLRIYVKNLEFDVVDARYHDDIRRDVTRVIKPGGRSLDDDEARALAEAEIRTFLD